MRPSEKSSAVFPAFLLAVGTPNVWALAGDARAVNTASATPIPIPLRPTQCGSRPRM